MWFFVKATVWVLARIIGVLGLLGLIAGIIDDVPGIKETKIGGRTLTLLSDVFTRGLDILYHYPIGVLLCVIVTCILRLVVIYPHSKKAKEQIQNKRRKKRSSLGRSPDRKKKPRRKK